MACVAMGMFACDCDGQEVERYEQEPFNYSAAVPHDGADLLQNQITAGDLKLGSTDRQAIEVLLRRFNCWSSLARASNENASARIIPAQFISMTIVMSGGYPAD